MTRLDEFFDKPAVWGHPRLQNWKARLDRPKVTATLQVTKQESEFGQVQPEMHVQFTEDGKLSPLESLPWDDYLNAGLIRLKVRSVSLENEAERFALGLRAALRKAERDFGDGYFNAVLLELIKDSDLTRHKEIAEVVKHAYANAPHREGGNFDRHTICRELIAEAIGGRAKELTEEVGYPPGVAKPIMVSALAHYLDERFTVSSRRKLDLL